MIVLARKQAEGTLPCYWFRLEEMAVGDALSLCGTALSDGINIVAAMAGSDISDDALAAGAAQALSVAALNDVHLRAGELRRPGAAA
jgi:hypothetical protein